MDASALSKLFFLFVLLLCSGFFSGAEAALFSLGLYRVRRLRSMSHRSYIAAQELLKDPNRLISTLLAGNELVNTAIGVLGASLVYELFESRVEGPYLSLLSVGLILPVLMIFGEITPKAFGLRHPERCASLAAPLLYWFSRLISPVRDALAEIMSFVLSLLGARPGDEGRVSEDVFCSMVDVGRKEGVLDEKEQELIHNVFRLDDRKVSQIMTPASKVSTMRADLTVADALKRCETDQYSRFPVLDLSGRTVIGTLYTKDLLGLGAAASGIPVEKYVRPPLLVSPALSALELFAQFRSRRTHFGIITDSDTHEMAGVVTLEDVLEEIFGAIRDERDVEEVLR